VDELEVLISSAQAGQQEARETVILRLKPLVVKTASSLSGRYIDPGSDEMSIGMIAVNQAIDKYQPSGGASFLSYAEMIIRRRLIDHYRQEQRAGRMLPLSSLERGDEEGQGPLEKISQQLGLAQFEQVREDEERREEIRRFAGQLQEYGITFPDLVAHSPRHEDARRRAMEIARQVTEHPEWLTHLKKKRELPLKSISLATAVSRKTLDRQRKYILGMIIVLLGDYNYLRSYLDKVMK